MCPTKELQGFKVLTLKLKFLGPERHLFFKVHSSRKLDPTKPEDRTSYLLNIPPWFADEEIIKKAFKHIGKVESVTFQVSEQGCGFKNAHIVFYTTEALDKAMKLSILGPIETPDDPLLTGVQKWNKDYNDNVLIGEKIPKMVAEIRRKYASEQKALRKKQRETEEEEDKEGWSTVTRKGRNPGLSRKESVVNRLQEKAEKKKKAEQNFYRHQIRESKQKKITELRDNYEKEKLRVAKMKASRKFRPY